MTNLIKRKSNKYRDVNFDTIGNKISRARRKAIRSLLEKSPDATSCIFYFDKYKFLTDCHINEK